MNSLTEKISLKLNLPVVPEFMTQGPYSMFDSGSAEVETLEFFYSLVRITKPDRVLETGSYQGMSAVYLAEGLKENKKGTLQTIEWEAQHLAIAKDRWNKLDLLPYITEYNMSSLNFQPQGLYDLILFDTEPQIRFQEIEKFWDYIRPGSIFLIHDLSYDLGTGAPQFWLNKELLDKRIRDKEVQVINFHTPRGLTMLRKLKPDDDIVRILI